MQKLGVGPLGLGGLPLVRTVAQDLEEALGRAVLVLERHHFATGPEAGTILLLVPPLVVAATVVQSALHFRVLRALLAILKREEHAGGLPDHLLFGPTENAMRALIPRSDQAVEVHCDDGIIRRAVQERLEKARAT